MMTQDEDAAADLVARWRAYPIDFVRENFGVEPDVWQREALEALAGPGIHRVSLQACAGPGKSAFDAWCLWWFLALHGMPGNYPKAACLSSTRENLRDNLWAELHKWYGHSEFLKSQFEINAERAFQIGHKAEWFISARSFAQSASPDVMGESLSGLHSDYVCVVLDECGSMHPLLLKRAEQAMATAKVGIIICSGNPTSRESCLFVASNDERFKRICITGDPDDPRRSPRVNIDEARDSINKYGRDNAWVMVYVLGQFPNSSLNTLLGDGEIRACLGRIIRATEYDWAQKRIGIDVARYGDDRTVLFPRQGKQAYNPVVMREQGGKEVAARYALGKSRFGSELDTIDDTGGWAGGVIEFSALAGNNILPVNMAGKADDSDAFANKRAEVYWRAMLWVKAGGALPDDEDLVKEGSASTYFMNGQGKIQIEEKEQVKKRIGKSPDKWDAFCLTFALPERASSAVDPMLSRLPGGVVRVVADVTNDLDPLGFRADEARSQQIKVEGAPWDRDGGPL